MDTASLRRQERIIAVVRWAAVLIAALLVAFYEPPRPELEAAAATARYRAYVLAAGLAFVGVVVEVALRVLRDPRHLRRFGLVVLVADSVLALGFVWAFAFDRFSPQWALLTILPLEGALRFQAAGAIGVWGAIAPAYLARDLYATRVHGIPFDEGIVAYRLGLLLVIALFAGASARELDLQRVALARLAAGQKHLAEVLEPAEILRTLCREAVGCLDARSATVYVEDPAGLHPVSAWPVDVLPEAVEEDVERSSDPAQLRIPLRWRHHPRHVLVVDADSSSDGFGRSVASSLAESAAVALANTEVILVEQRATRRLRHLEALRTRFVATIAHDLRRPLTVFKGVSALLRSRRDDIAPHEVDQMLRSVERQANRLSRLADDLLDGARLESDALVLQPRPCDLEGVIAGAVADMEEEVSVKTEGNLRIVADPARLDRVLWNLLSNAEKYGKPPFEIRAWRHGTLAHIEIRDHGPGLDGRQRASLFDAFVTSDAAAGVGLGLAIVWQLVTAHGGAVRYEDAEPGARFVVSVPTAGPAPVGAERTARD